MLFFALFEILNNLENIIPVALYNGIISEFGMNSKILLVKLLSVEGYPINIESILQNLTPVRYTI